MMKYIEAEGSAKNLNEALEEAISSATAALDVDRDSVSVEILERGKSGFLGLGGIYVRIKVGYEAPDPVPETCGRAVKEFLDGLFELMKADATVEISEENDVVNAIVKGEDAGVLIGRHGENLDALQYITALAVNKNSENRTKVKVDMENYRERRTQTLEAMAKRLAERAVRTGRNVTADVMSAHERRIIHTALQNYPGVTTFSVGKEPNRRVVVAVSGGNRRKPANRRPSAPKAEAPKAE